jgi:phosphorylase kinase alpha/beta subunit
MAGEDRRPSAVLSVNSFIKAPETALQSSSSKVKTLERIPSPADDMLAWKINSPKPTRHRLNSETQYADTEVEELMAMIRETESLEEQGDILQYLVSNLLRIFIT